MDAALVRYIELSISQKLPFSVMYQGHKRFVCPHLLGENAAGRLVLHAFQYAGGSSKGEIESPEKGEWRFLYLDGFESFPEGAWSEWLPAGLKKSDVEEKYVPPKFIVRVLAICPRETES